MHVFSKYEQNRQRIIKKIPNKFGSASKTMVCYRLVSIPIFSNFQLGMKYGSQVFE
jgi:hypothetical protein